MMEANSSQLYSAAAAQNGANELAYVPDSVDIGQQGVGEGVAGHNPGAIWSLSWSKNVWDWRFSMKYPGE